MCISRRLIIGLITAVFLTVSHQTYSHAQTTATDASRLPQPNPKNRMLSPAQIRADVELAEEAYRRVHPGYTRYEDAEVLKSAWNDIITDAQAASGMSVGRLYLRIEKALTLIRCDHTKAELPAALRKSRKENPLYLPFRWKLIEGRGLVSAPGDNIDLAYGDEIIAIDGRPLQTIIDEVAPYIPVDGYTEWSRRGGISESLEFMGGAVDHFGALIWDIPANATLTIRKLNGDIADVIAPRINYDAWTELGNRSGLARNFKDAVTFERLGDNAAYVRVDTFVNYRVPVKPDTIYGPIFKAIKDEQRDTLIVDLRNNGGGSSDASHGLVAHLIKKPMRLKKEMRVATLNLDGLRDHMFTWDKRALNPNPLGFKKNEDGTYSLRRFVSEDMKTVKPNRHAFTGKLILLTSNNNSSGSTNIISVLKGLGRATLIGEKTGGSAEGPTAGILFTLTLPESGIKTRVPFFRYFNNVPSFEHGLGMNPDIEAPMTYEAFLEKRDPALEKAKEIISEE